MDGMWDVLKDEFPSAKGINVLKLEFKKNKN